MAVDKRLEKGEQLSSWQLMEMTVDEVCRQMDLKDSDDKAHRSQHSAKYDCSLGKPDSKSGGTADDVSNTFAAVKALLLVHEKQLIGAPSNCLTTTTTTTMLLKGCL